MTHPRVLTATTCDDVRREVGNKISLIGIYEEVLFLPHFPTTLPKLCFVLRAITPVETPFKSLTVKVLRDDEVIAQVDFAQEGLAELTHAEPDSLRTIVSVLQVIPMHFEAECKLRFRAQTETEELKAGGIVVRKAPEGAVFA